ncbi:helix-turn-helix transcriptional regulator [Aurantiacibacter zhengii]|uniref:AlpA family transcriptional regulator n=1 Tax=Aurantiacibacter zhengii TaxID=2307003 RepID=A0A418NVF3_9SPHN|nr:AlpA family transcriptional regulator [Aurantiacibacter zhengii]RIV87994.1 AlpA family transcriptional regulator [Aurantiacibacter zhengii]
MFEEQHPVRDETDRPTRLIRIREVQHRVGLGRSTIYRWMAEGKFPKPVRLGSYAVAWNDADIENWVKELTAPKPKKYGALRDSEIPRSGRCADS